MSTTQEEGNKEKLKALQLFLKGTGDAAKYVGAVDGSPDSSMNAAIERLSAKLKESNKESPPQSVKVQEDGSIVGDPDSLKGAYKNLIKNDLYNVFEKSPGWDGSEIKDDAVLQIAITKTRDWFTSKFPNNPKIVDVFNSSVRSLNLLDLSNAFAIANSRDAKMLKQVKAAFLLAKDTFSQLKKPL